MASPVYAFNNERNMLFFFLKRGHLPDLIKFLDLMMQWVFWIIQTGTVRSREPTEAENFFQLRQNRMSKRLEA